MKYAIKNSSNLYYNFASGYFTDMNHECLLPSLSLAEYVLNPGGDYCGNEDAKHTPLFILFSNYFEVPINHSILTIESIAIESGLEGYAIQTSEGLFYNFETDLPDTWNENCLLPSFAIADHFANGVYEGHYHYPKHQLESASLYTQQHGDYLALFVIRIDKKVHQFLLSEEASKWNSIIESEISKSKYLIYCSVYLRLYGNRYELISMILDTPIKTIKDRITKYRKKGFYEFVNYNLYYKHELLTRLGITKGKFDWDLERGTIPPADGKSSAGKFYWKHETVSHLLLKSKI